MAVGELLKRCKLLRVLRSRHVLEEVLPRVQASDEIAVFSDIVIAGTSGGDGW